MKMNVEIEPAVLCGMINAPLKDAKVAVETLHVLLKDLPDKQNAVAIKSQIGGARWFLVKKGDTWVVDVRMFEEAPAQRANPSDL